MIPQDIGVLLDMGSGIFLVLLGAAVLLVRPRRRVNVAFAVFAIAFGLRFFLGSLAGPTDPAAPRMLWLGAAATVVAAVALFLMMLQAPQPLRRSERRDLAVPLLIGGTFMALAGWASVVHLGGDLARAGAPTESRMALIAFAVTLAVVVGVLHFGIALLARRASRAPQDPEARTRHERAATFLTAALLPYPAFIAAYGPYDTAGLLAGHPFGMTWAVAGLGAVAACAALWLWGTTRMQDARAARNVAIFALGLSLAGLLASAWAPRAGWHGGTRILTVALVAYAVLRHQLLDIDVKVKWTLTQSTVAAVFLAAIFFASEGAQLVFGDGQEWLGLAAGGALVFALAPLQRFAERVSDKAMPGVKAVGDMGPDERLALYRDQLEAAYADGAVDGSERQLLERLRLRLGIGAEAAMQLEREVAP